MFKSTNNGILLPSIFSIIFLASTQSAFGLSFFDRMKVTLPSAAERYTGETTKGFADIIVRQAQSDFAAKRRKNGSTGMIGDLFESAKEVLPALVLGAVAYALVQDGSIGSMLSASDIIQNGMQERFGRSQDHRQEHAGHYHNHYHNRY